MPFLVKIAVIITFLLFATIALATDRAFSRDEVLRQRVKWSKLDAERKVKKSKLNAEGQLQDPKALISITNIALERTLLPLTHVTFVNTTENDIRLVINDVVEIVAELTSGLRKSSLSSCAKGCTAIDIVELIAITLKIICEPLGIAYGKNPRLVALLGRTRLVDVMIKLLDAVLVLAGGDFGKLIVFLIRNGCAKIMVDLELIGLLTTLGLEGLGLLGSFIGNLAMGGPV